MGGTAREGLTKFRRVKYVLVDLLLDAAGSNKDDVLIC